MMLRGNGGQKIFFGGEDYERLYLFLQEGTARFGYHVHAFCDCHRPESESSRSTGSHRLSIGADAICNANGNGPAILKRRHNVEQGSSADRPTGGEVQGRVQAAMGSSRLTLIANPDPLL